MIIIIIVLCITGLEFYAISKGIDGKLLWCVIGILSTIAGWQGKKKQTNVRTKKLTETIEKFEAGEIEAGLKELQNVR
jgi:hypothetical protein